MSTSARVAPSTLRPLFAPSVVALVGASSTHGKLGWAMGESLRQFPGTVHHINKLRPDPDNGVYATVAEAAASTGAVPDLAVMCVPAAVTVDAVRDAALAGTQLAIVCAGGFAESGVNGALMQQELSHVCSETGIRVLGPNTSGVIVPPAGLIASFVPGLDVVREGPVAVIAASGGVNHALTFALSNRNIGIRVAVGLGNAVDIDMADVLEALADDAETGLIALHIESIGDGRRLVEAVARVVDRIPVIASVIGRADVAEFAKSHTGALAAPWRTTRAALRHAGAVIVDDERELIEAITALSLLRVERRSAPPGGRYWPTGIILC
jgi:acyl-CoA synthetase (NDP forming)